MHRAVLLLVDPVQYIEQTAFKEFANLFVHALATQHSERTKWRIACVGSGLNPSGAPCWMAWEAGCKALRSTFGTRARRSRSVKSSSNPADRPTPESLHQALSDCVDALDTPTLLDFIWVSSGVLHPEHGIEALAIYGTLCRLRETVPSFQLSIVYNGSDSSNIELWRQLFLDCTATFNATSQPLSDITSSILEHDCQWRGTVDFVPTECLLSPSDTASRIGVPMLRIVKRHSSHTAVLNLPHNARLVVVRVVCRADVADWLLREDEWELRCGGSPDSVATTFLQQWACSAQSKPEHAIALVVAPLSISFFPREATPQQRRAIWEQHVVEGTPLPICVDESENADCLVVFCEGESIVVRALRDVASFRSAIQCNESEEVQAALSRYPMLVWEEAVEGKWKTQPATDIRCAELTYVRLASAIYEGKRNRKQSTTLTVSGAKQGEGSKPIKRKKKYTGSVLPQVNSLLDLLLRLPTPKLETVRAAVEAELAHRQTTQPAGQKAKTS